jgi:NADH-quinone oxidoreductase subunit C
MTTKEIFDSLKEKYSDAVTEIITGIPVEEFINVSPDKVDEICLLLRDGDEYRFDSLSCLSGVDNNNGTLSAVYHLYSYEKHHKVCLKTTVSKDAPDIKSVSSVWLTANWHEREAFDMIGINFVGHADLRRILCPYDWEGYPLRKDYEVPEFYHGMRVPY